MELKNFKKREGEVVSKCIATNTRYTIFNNEKGIKGYDITLFKNELNYELGKGSYVFVEVEGVVLYHLFNRIVWVKKTPTHKNESISFTLDQENTAERFFKEVNVFKEVSVFNPNHYGGEKNPLEVRKIIKHYNLGFNLGNVVKYVIRAGKKDPTKYNEDLKKAIEYLQFELEENAD